MSGTDEELEFVHAQGMDHVTYILIMFRYVIMSLTFNHYPIGFLSLYHSLAFLLYTLIVSLINLYAGSGRNASPSSGDIFEMAAVATNWYSRVPETPVDVEPRTDHVIGDDD